MFAVVATRHPASNRGIPAFIRGRLAQVLHDPIDRLAEGFQQPGAEVIARRPQLAPGAALDGYLSQARVDMAQYAERSAQAIACERRIAAGACDT